MADLDNKKLWGPGGAIVEGDGVIWSKTLTVGRTYDFALLVSSKDDVAVSASANLHYSALLIVTVSYNTVGPVWVVNYQASGAAGGATPTWSAAMSGNVLQVSVSGGAASWGHSVCICGGTQYDFAQSYSAA